MPEKPPSQSPWAPHLRAAVEIAFILFLFYANLLMGEFTGSNAPGRSLAFAIVDIVTVKNFLIGLVAAIVGHLAFDKIRQKL